MVNIKDHTFRFRDIMEDIICSDGLTDQQFADKIGVARTLVSHVRACKQNASIDFIIETAKVYKEINTDYILMGRGERWMDDEEIVEINTIDEIRDKANQQILKLQEELKEAYMEIGRLNMELKSAKEHNSLLKRG